MLKWQLHCDVSQHSRLQQSLDLRLNSYVFLFVFCLFYLVNAGYFSHKHRSKVLATMVYHVTCGGYLSVKQLYFSLFEHVYRVQASVCQYVSLIKRLLSFLDTCPGTWLDWDELIPAITTPAAVSSGEQELAQIRHPRQRGCKEGAKKEASWSCAVGLWIIYKNCVNDRRKAGMGWSCSVTLHVSKTILFFSFPVSWHRLLGSQSLSQTPSVLK